MIIERTTNSRKALKNQLTGSIDSKFIANLHDNYTGYNNHTISKILQDLYTNYGDLTECDLEDIEKTINIQFDPTEPFGTFVKRIEDCMDVTEAAGAQYMAQQIVNKAFSLIIKSDAFPDGVCEWRQKPTLDKTWVYLKKFSCRRS